MKRLLLLKYSDFRLILTACGGLQKCGAKLLRPAFGNKVINHVFASERLVASTKDNECTNLKHLEPVQLIFMEEMIMKSSQENREYFAQFLKG